jgi:hypothetical protein
MTSVLTRTANGLELAVRGAVLLRRAENLELNAGHVLVHARLRIL